ncbi:MAG: hypothetical protein IT424_01825 [Pirellulales bacterium]|nr:hypothetical protein [Pirellulales bacterium]
MTSILQQAFERAAKLAPAEQVRWGAWMLEELESEERWDQLFARSQGLLERMADEAMTEHRAGRTMPLDPDAL